MDGINGWEILLFVLAVVGWIGSIVPVMPGLPLTLIALIVYGVVTGFQEVSVALVFSAIVLSGIAFVSSYFLGSLLSRRYGNIRVPSLALLLGSILGLLSVGPFGLVIGPVVVVFVVALLSGAEPGRGIRSAIAVAVSMIANVILEFLVSGWMVYILFSRIFL